MAHRQPHATTAVALLALHLAALGLWGCKLEPRAPEPTATQPSSTQSSPRPKPPEPAESFETIEGFDGATAEHLLARAARFERGAIVNVWASWCGSCKKELPMLKEVLAAYAPHGLGLITVSADEPEALPKARQLLETAGLTGERFYLAGPVSRFIQRLDPRWKGAVPATFLVDAAGKVRYFWNGPVMADEIREVAQGYLAGDAIDGMTDFTVSE